MMNGEKLMNLTQAFIQVASLRCWRCSGLTRDPRADAVCSLVDLRERNAAKISVHQSRSECVASANGVGHLHFEAVMLDAFVSGYQQAAVSAASNANQIQIVRGEQT